MQLRMPNRIELQLKGLLHSYPDGLLHAACIVETGTKYKMSTTSLLKTNNGSFNKKKWLIDDDDTGYLSQETRNRRADQKLINNITSALVSSYHNYDDRRR
jgi:hypothetical protein